MVILSLRVSWYGPELHQADTASNELRKLGGPNPRGRFRGNAKEPTACMMKIHLDASHAIAW